MKKVAVKCLVARLGFMGQRSDAGAVSGKSCLFEFLFDWKSGFCPILFKANRGR
ncbi:hypothetical protein G3N28_00580 [Desulfobacter hydrogenophilus]|nr:hypothetical protein [Desulfobacter hydrogenophilus]NDY70588.1 hypothetical protein [Desulfobacter hydrogenophilus]